MSHPPPPIRCGHCGATLVAPRAHCASHSCAWIVCPNCHAVISEDGSHTHAHHGIPESHCREQGV